MGLLSCRVIHISCAMDTGKSEGFGLILDAIRVEEQVGRYRNAARSFYYSVMLTRYACPTCGSSLAMAGQSRCVCQNGHGFDPTVAFQKSPCCRASLNRETFHYACSACNRTVPSLFLFDEKLFDRAYFRERMQSARQKAAEKRERVRKLLAESRSGTLEITETISLENIPGLLGDLDAFVSSGIPDSESFRLETPSWLRLEQYRTHLLPMIGWSDTAFSRLTPLYGDEKADRIWRFIALVYMDHEGEVFLSEEEGGLWVRRVFHEAD